jgi:hypothetical protein
MNRGAGYKFATPPKRGPALPLENRAADCSSLIMRREIAAIDMWLSFATISIYFDAVIWDVLVAGVTLTPPHRGS